MAPTIKEVGKRAGVSIITVSWVINGADYVRTETQAWVQEAIDALHYVPRGRFLTHRRPSQRWASTRLGERISSGRAA